MDAQIDENGLLIITPLTLTEETALRAWREKAWVEMTDEKLKEKGHWRGSRVLLRQIVRSA